LSQVLHDIEKQIINVLQSDPDITEEKISQETKLSMDQIRRGVEWLRQKKLADVSESVNISLSLGKNGLDALKNGLPERRLVNLVKDGPKTFDEIRSSLHGFDFNAAIAHAKKNDWINIEKTGTGSKISLKDPDAEVPNDSDLIISKLGEKTIVPTEFDNTPLAVPLKSLMERPDFIIAHEEKTKTVSLSETGKKIDLEKLDSGAIDVEADVPHVHAARIHPLKTQYMKLGKLLLTWDSWKLLEICHSQVSGTLMHCLHHRITQLGNYKTHFILKVLMQNNMQHQLKLRMYQMHIKKAGDTIGIYRKQKKWSCEHIPLVLP